MSKLKKALSQQKKQTQLVEQEIYGSLGIPLGGQRVVNVANRQGFVYVKLRDNQNEVIQAFNNQVAASYDLPVVVIRTGNKYSVRGVNTERYQNNNYTPAPLLPSHGSSHSFVEGAGGDTTWVFSRQNMPLLVHPSRTTGSIVEIAKHPMQAIDGSWKLVGGTGTSTLLTYRPTGTQAIMALVYMDAQTGNPGLLIGTGTPFDNVLTGSNSIYQYIPRHNPANQIPLAAVRMDTGTYSLGWENLYDLRQWVQVAPTGSASTPGASSGFGVVGQDEGVFLGTGSTLNFVGAGVTASISGSVIMVDIPGGGGGGGGAGIYGIANGVPLGTGTSLNVQGNASFTISGSRLNLNVGNPFIVAHDEGVPLGSGSVINFVGSGVTATVSGSVVQVSISSSGSGTGSSSVAPLKSTWDVDAPPLAPTSIDDEFADGSLDVKWTEFDPNSVLTITEGSDTGHIRFASSSGGGAWKVGGLYQGIPTGDFSIITKISMLAAGANYFFGGLALWENAADNTKRIQLYGLGYRSGGQNMSIIAMTDHDTYSSTPVDLSVNYGWDQGYYLRLRRNGTNYYFDWSTDGLSWYTYGSPTAINPAFTPAHFGIHATNYSTNSTLLISNFFRYVASDVGTTGVLAGQLVGIYSTVGSGGNGVSGLFGQNDGSPLGTGTILNVTGGGATLTHSGTVLNLNVPSATGTQHNSLQGIQGGAPNEYYHLASGTYWNSQSNGWNLISGTVTFLRADAPSYEVYLGYNVTGSIGVGAKIGLRHQSQDKFFFVTAVGVTGSNTYLNLYGGTDYTLNVTGAISAPVYSQAKAPFGFPLIPSKWTVTTISTGNLSQASPVATQWYNLGSLSISMPIGAWRAYFKSVGDAIAAAAAVSVNQFVSLTTSSASPPVETNTELTIGGANTIATATDALRLPYISPTTILLATSKTTWYLITKTNAANHTSIAIRGDLFATVISFECAYL